MKTREHINHYPPRRRARPPPVPEREVEMPCRVLVWESDEAKKDDLGMVLKTSGLEVLAANDRWSMADMVSRVMLGELEVDIVVCFLHRFGWPMLEALSELNGRSWYGALVVIADANSMEERGWTRALESAVVFLRPYSTHRLVRVIRALSPTHDPRPNQQSRAIPDF